MSCFISHFRQIGIPTVSLGLVRPLGPGLSPNPGFLRASANGQPKIRISHSESIRRAPLRNLTGNHAIDSEAFPRYHRFSVQMMAKMIPDVFRRRAIPVVPGRVNKGENITLFVQCKYGTKNVLVLHRDRCWSNSRREVGIALETHKSHHKICYHILSALRADCAG